MDIARRAAARTAPHVVADLAAIGRTRPHIHPRPILVQGTAVVVGPVVVTPVQAAAGRVGRLPDRL